MTRYKDIKLPNGAWVLVAETPDWRKMEELAKKVDRGDLSVLEELIDLIIYEEETDKMMKYIALGAKLGNDKARYEKVKELNDWNIKKLLMLRKLAEKYILEFRYEYQRVRKHFIIFYGGLVVLTVIGIGIAYELYQFLKCYVV